MNVISFELPDVSKGFALLDDAQADHASSRLYSGLQNILCCADAQAWPQFWHDTQQALQQGQYAVALLSYETGAQLQGISSQATGLSRIVLFRDCLHLTQEQVQEFLQAQTSAVASTDMDVAGIANIEASVDEQDFARAIARVQDYIAAGDTYQVNYTYRLHFDVYGTPLALYRRLRQRQPVPYGALICLPQGEAILSMSPELFVRHTRGELLAKPMKGTAAASGDANQDHRLAQALAADEKNRAENLMIVDLLRNDLGRIADTGSVQVTQLFEVTRYSSVLQMTSTIHARLRPQLGLPEVLTALFPCGSITGAPKRRTMQIIHELETLPRNLYTGAIGWFDPPPHKTEPGSLGDFCLSVPIRTLQLAAPMHRDEGLTVRRGVMGVGAGIVYDSVAADEFAECQLKATFLTGLPAPFDLFETMQATREDGCRYLERHLHRLRTSAAYFGFVWNELAIRQSLQDFCQSLPPQTAYRLRVSLNAQGEITLNSGVLAALSFAGLRPKVVLAALTTHSNDLFLRHKTSVRQRYDQAWKQAEAQGAFDMLFFNEHGHLTEGARSNVLLRQGQQWLTPPLNAGILPGVMRAVLLDDANYAIREQTLTRADLLAADQVMLCNSLRGVFDVELVLSE